jgi:hypothetical protein
VKHPADDRNAHKGKYPISPDSFLANLHETGMYALTQGMPFLVNNHFQFVQAYLDAWQTKTTDPAEIEASPELTVVLADLKDFTAGTLPRSNRMFFLLWNFCQAVYGSIILIFTPRVSVVAPLITSVVFFFVTADGWEFFGTGFTLRFAETVTLFLLVSLFILIRGQNYWERDINIKASNRILTALVGQIQRDMLRREQKADRRVQADLVDNPHLHDHFKQLIDLGAEPVPFMKPSRPLGRLAVRGAYIVFVTASLIGVAIIVSWFLMFVGLVLVSLTETRRLVGGQPEIYWYLPGENLVITAQLMSLSIGLGAFAVFFLVAGQNAKDRREFINNGTAFLRRALIVYTVYYHAREHAPDWTGVPVKSVPQVRDR